MRVWIGCLACYNEGRLIGHWFDADEASEVTVGQVHKAGGYRPFDTGLRTPDAARWSPEGVEPDDLSNHEELWCFDHDEFGGLLDGECSPSEATRIAELVSDLDDIEREALAAYRQHEGDSLDSDAIERFRDAFAGGHDSERDFAEELADDLGALNPDAGWPARYIDWDAAARDLFIDSFWSADRSGGGVFVFYRV